MYHCGTLQAPAFLFAIAQERGSTLLVVRLVSCRQGCHVARHTRTSSSLSVRTPTSVIDPHPFSLLSPTCPQRIPGRLPFSPVLSLFITVSRHSVCHLTVVPTTLPGTSWVSRRSDPPVESRSDTHPKDHTHRDRSVSVPKVRS